MLKIYKSVEELVGNTPLFEPVCLEQELNLCANLYLKLEYFNPAGSIKDRAAKQMIIDAEQSGELKAGGTIIEATSGNTGIGLAAVSTSRGYRVIIVMPDTMSVERRTLMKAYGAELVLTDGKKGMKGAIEKAEALKREIKGAIIMGQFVNKSNAKAHYNTTGPEIYNDLNGEVDILVAGVGTGGTITGAGKYLKEQNKDIKIVAVEPKNSAVLSGEAAGPHGLQGIGAGFIPEVLDTGVIDQIIKVEEKDAYFAARLLGAKEGIFTGISSGAALFAAIELARQNENKNKKIAVILPDTGDRYLSTAMFE